MRIQYQDEIDDIVLSGKPDDRKDDRTEEFTQQLEFTSLLAEEIGSREEKLLKIRMWERQEKLKKLVSKTLSCSAVAAVLALGIFRFSPSMWIPRPAHIEIETVSRGEVNLDYLANLVNSGAYIEAIAKADDILCNLQSDLSKGQSSDEVIAYRKAMSDAMAYEVRWIKANASLGLGKVEEARAMFKEIMSEQGEHQSDARSLYRKLKHKKNR